MSLFGSIALSENSLGEDFLEVLDDEEDDDDDDKFL